MPKYIVTLRNPFTLLETPYQTKIYVEKDPIAGILYGTECQNAARFNNRNETRKAMNHVATQFVHELGYLRSPNPKVIPVNE